MNDSLQNINNLSLVALEAQIIGLGEPRYRCRQLIDWLYRKRVGSFERMTNLPKSCKTLLENHFILEKMEPRYSLESAAGDAVKFGFPIAQANVTTHLGGRSVDIIESVILRDGRRRTLCVSSQAGCPLGCTFCATGALGFSRNLSLSEIVGQILAGQDYCADRDDPLLTNIVFMGMGEALLNFDNLMATLQILTDPACLGMSPHRITVSTAGVIPGIRNLMEHSKGVGLAISLNAPDDALRSRLMPINEKYPIGELIECGRQYHVANGGQVTFEYILMDGVNDSVDQARRLARLLGSVPCKINLIPFNPVSTTPLQCQAPPSERIDAFASVLAERNLVVTVRRSLGQDISGACGQLAGSAGGNAVALS